MPDVQATNPIGVLASDVHLSESPPIARAGEPDWYAAMQRPLDELNDLVDRLQVPLFYGGDIFHKWNPGPELINFAIRYLPKGFSVPGQHDLPSHRYDDVHKSAYWTLVRAGILIECGKRGHATRKTGAVEFNFPTDMRVWGYPWGFRPDFLIDDGVDNRGRILIGLIHAFVHSPLDPAAMEIPPNSNVEDWRRQFSGFDFALFGDNHIPLLDQKKGETTIVNPGSMMRRNRNQLDHSPRVAILYSDGTAKWHYLDCSKDRIDWEAPAIPAAVETDSDFLDYVKQLAASPADYPEAIRQAIAARGPNAAVEALLLKSLEDQKR